MNTFLLILLGLASIVLIASILLQSGNSAGLSGSIGGGAEQLFGKKRARKYDAVLNERNKLKAGKCLRKCIIKRRQRR